MLKPEATTRNLSENNIKMIMIAEKIKQNPSNREAYIELAVELTRLNRLEDAIKSFNKACRIQEDYITLYNIACLYYKKYDYKNAIIQLEKSKIINPEFNMLFLLAGLCYGRLKNYKAAESNFIRVIMTDPDNITALTALSILFYNQGKTEDSLKLIRKISNSGTETETVSKIKSEILFNSGKTEESADEIKFIKNNSSKFRNFNNFINTIPVSILTDKYGSIEEKIYQLENEAIKTKNNLISLSLCHLFSGNTDSAIDYLIQAREKAVL